MKKYQSPTSTCLYLQSSTLLTLSASINSGSTPIDASDGLAPNFGGMGGFNSDFDDPSFGETVEGNN